MSVVLDTDTFAPAERLDALAALFDAHEVPQRVAFAVPADRVRYRLHLYGCGSGTHLLHNQGTGLVIERTDRHVRQGAPEQLALFAGRSGSGTLRSGDGVSGFRAGDLGAMTTMHPYLWHQSEHADHHTLVVDAAGRVPVDVLLASTELLARSPLRRLLQTQLAALCLYAGTLQDAAREALGQATVELAVAALLVADGGRLAADGGRRAAQALDETLFARMTAYADAHLHEPDLDPARIAAAHFVSTRHVYAVWARETGTSPHRWVMQRRLERAATLLAERSRDTLPIGWVARQCGFTNMSHFARRFRAARGMSPRDWSQAHGRG